MTAEPVVAISAIEHYAYCPRQCALVHLDGVWQDNVHTLRGDLGHRRADTPSSRQERGVRVMRAVPLWSETLGLTGRADAVELTAAGEVVPVEYKMGGPHGDTAHLQLCAPAMCLEEMLGLGVRQGALWFSGPRRRVRVALDDGLRARTLAAIAAVRDLLVGTALPPAPNDQRCDQCQLLGHCLPGLVSEPARAIAYLRDVVGCEP